MVKPKKRNSLTSKQRRGQAKVKVPKIKSHGKRTKSRNKK